MSRGMPCPQDQNFSQKPPDGKTQGVSQMNLVDTTPEDYDPDEDRYGVEAQAERMAALREKMEQEREDAPLSNRQCNIVSPIADIRMEFGFRRFIPGRRLSRSTR